MQLINALNAAQWKDYSQPAEWDNILYIKSWLREVKFKNKICKILHEYNSTVGIMTSDKIKPVL